jgi:thiol peroxidase
MGEALKMLVLQGKYKELGDEAPAIRVKMLDGGVKVIGMMADKVQVIFTFPSLEGIGELLSSLVLNYENKANIYLIGSDDKFHSKTIDKSNVSCDFEKLSMKYGVNVDENLCTKSVFIINKDGEIVYKEVLEDLESTLDLETFEKELESAINFKKKGHHHEDWMGV